MERTILHLDLDAFFCAVEELLNPDLAGIAFAVGGDADRRGVVASCSYPARMFGVRSAMPMATAQRICPNLIVVPQTRHAYESHSRRVMSILQNLSPLVEQLSIDEAFIDVTGLRKSPQQIAKDLQQRIWQETHLPCSIGVASNKLIAKIANNQGKARHQSPHPPNAIEVVPIGEEAQYLAPLDITELWGVGPKTAEQLRALGIHTIGTIAFQSRDNMVRHFGKHGYDMWRRAQGIDNRPVEPEQEAKSISHETTFAHDLTNGDELVRVLRELVEGVGQRLRKNQLSGKTVFIKLRWSDFTTFTRQTTLMHPTQDNKIIADTAVQLFMTHWPKGRSVRLIGIGVSNLESVVRQLELWETEETKKNRQLQGTLDELREKFGDGSIKRGIDMKRKKK